MNDFILVTDAVSNDLPGIAPLEIPPAQRSQFVHVREQYAKAVAFSGAVPLQPQSSCATPKDYEQQLLADIARQLPTWKRLPPEGVRDIISGAGKSAPNLAHNIVNEAMAEPYRVGELRSITRTD